MSIRSNYPTLRKGNVFIVEPYSPHRFSRQFGFFRDSRNRLDQDFREASLEYGLRLARICVLIKPRSKSTFPPHTSNMKKFASQNYKSWWEKMNKNLFENHVQCLVNVVGSITDALQKNDETVLIRK